jgi:hypothetical protein
MHYNIDNFLIYPFGWNVVADNVNRVFRHNDVLRLNLVYFRNSAGEFILALHQQLVLVLANSDHHRFVQRRSPIIHHDGFVFHDGQFHGVIEARVAWQTIRGIFGWHYALAVGVVIGGVVIGGVVISGVGRGARGRLSAHCVIVIFFVKLCSKTGLYL